jgi:hypothetical protein
MPQHVGPRFRIKGYPAYEYTDGGAEALEKFDIKSAYRTELKRYGISTSGVFRAAKK